MIKYSTNRFENGQQVATAMATPNPGIAPSPMLDDVTIRIQKLYKHYGKTIAIQGIDLEIHRGELFGLIGPDGAGKTTAFNILGGVMEATAGTAQILGLPARDARNHTGYLTQQFSLYPDLSVDENIHYSAGLRLVPENQLEGGVDGAGNHRGCSDVINARVTQLAVDGTTLSAVQNHLGKLSEMLGVVSQVRLWFNPGRQESLFIVPGSYGVIPAIFPPLLIAIALVREKEQGTILQLYASSLSAFELCTCALLHRTLP